MNIGELAIFTGSVLLGIVVFIYHTRQTRSPNQFHLNENERLLHQRVFNELSPEQFSRLIQLAQWQQISNGSTLVKQGEVVNNLSLLFQGQLKVDLGKNAGTVIREGQFVGEMSFVSGNPASVTVIAVQDCMLVQWPQKVLKEFLNNNAAVSNCVQSLFQRDLINKLEK